ncbi:phosphatase 2C-like domain-containing protein [Mycena sp. CBHHK59/15]|nr:phosphatase 2C-like domain-containing protein [Mycena sp. CBHHK59/15]
MVFGPASSFARWRTCPPLAALRDSRRRVWMATRIALGVSASIYLATLNSMHGDSENDDIGSNTDPITSSPLDAGFMADPTSWNYAYRHLGQGIPFGITRLYWYSRFDTRIRIMSRGPRTLISLVEGDLVTRANVADVIEENLWSNLEALFRWHKIDDSAPQPVEFSQEIHPPPEAIYNVFKTVVSLTDEYNVKHFLQRAFSSPSKQQGVPAMFKATASSCLISALYESDVRLLHVANLGNMRGILGRPQEQEDGSVIYDVHVLSADHTPDNPAEQSRINSLHPGEDVVKDGQLFGRPYTRALGDGTLKWSPAVQTRLHKEYLGAPPAPEVKTPPYLSAEPDVSTIKIEPGDVLVLSSPWLVECLTDEEAVGLVGVWMEKNRDTTLYMPLDGMPLTDPTPGEAIKPEELPVRLKQDTTTMYRRWNTRKLFVNEDTNPATHLANNALGGADADLREALLELNPHESEGNSKSLGIVVVIFE